MIRFNSAGFRDIHSPSAQLPEGGRWTASVANNCRRLIPPGSGGCIRSRVRSSRSLKDSGRTSVLLSKQERKMYVIPVGPVNTFLLESSNGCTLIDFGLPGSAEKILQAAQELGKKPNDIRFGISC